MKEYSVKLFWDEESSTWVATSDDIPGLVLGSGSVDLLMERVRFAAPEIMELNHMDSKNCTLHFHFDRYADSEPPETTMPPKAASRYGKGTQPPFGDRGQVF